MHDDDNISGQRYLCWWCLLCCISGVYCGRSVIDYVLTIDCLGGGGVVGWWIWATLVALLDFFTIMKKSRRYGLTLFISFARTFARLTPPLAPLSLLSKSVLCFFCDLLLHLISGF